MYLYIHLCFCRTGPVKIVKAPIGHEPGQQLIVFFFFFFFYKKPLTVKKKKGYLLPPTRVGVIMPYKACDQYSPEFPNQ